MSFPQLINSNPQ